MDDARLLERLNQFRPRQKASAAALGPDMVSFFKKSVAQRQNKLVKIAECWQTLVPELLSEHCALESLARGNLTVLVDSSSHLYEIKQLLLAGLQDQLLLACKITGLKKITLKLGRWYDENETQKNPRFK